ncbi:peptidylprolyl isomerase [Sphingomonas sp. So64.6b]|uniref:peptidylprolyl isomerase n=1 Tax=Sphingomonas sp. So64.6b TaxID=2997354 RepID=UPI001601068D|nr:peptidylprolyl isomerase [Sphingomonas sp. So64.6b]QNA85544.1 peptidylprolyl isomerase [Sphingomonas sp. So64.6b]
MLIPLLSLLAFAQATPPTPAAPAATPPAPLPSDVAEQDWRAIPDNELLVMTLTGNRTVVIRLAARFAPEHVANVRTLAKAGWWDASSVYRVQENWVAQWGDATEKKPLAPGVVKIPAAEYEFAGFTVAQRLSKADSHSTASGFTADGWPIATDGKMAWLTHCYGTVGVARDSAPDTGSGSELFTPIGQSARRLDRNYTVVGRIIEGMKYLSALPRSDAAMGVYATEAERSGIVSVRLASDMPVAERPKFEYRSTDNERFAAYIKLRENPAAPMIGSGLEVCEMPLATRRVPVK